MTKITWPSSPSYGDKYQSSLGDTWYWDGCGWISSCCGLPCSPESGITLIVNFGDGIVSFPLSYASYGTTTVWYTVLEPGQYIYVRSSLTGWELIAPSESGGYLTLATLDFTGSTVPIGEWQVIDETIASISTQCGLVNTYCVFLALPDSSGQANFNQTFSPSGEALPIYQSIIGTIIWEEETNSWNFLLNGETLAATIPGVVSEFPVGEWTILVPEIVSMSTSGEPCVCDPFSQGLTLNVNYNINGDDINFWIELQTDGSSFINSTGEVTISESAGVYTLSIESSPIAESISVLGPWTVLNAQVNQIATTCGPLPLTSICLQVDDGVNPAVSENLFRADIQSGTTLTSLYTSFNGDYQIVFAAAYNQWLVSTSSPSYTEIGIYPGSITDPFNDGNLVTSTPPYSITISEGVCPP